MMCLKIALRNLRRQKNHTLLLIAAISFGIYIITMINGFSGSFVENVRDNFANVLAGHIFIEGATKSAYGKSLLLIKDDTQLMQAINQSGVDWKYFTKRSQLQAILLFEGKDVLQNIIGVDWESEQMFKDQILIKYGTFEDLSTDSCGIALNENVAKELNIQVGECLIVKCQTNTGQQNVGEFVVKAIYTNSSLYGNSTAFANLSYVNELLNMMPDEYMTLGIFINEPNKIDMNATLLYNNLHSRVNMFERKIEKQITFWEMVQQQNDENWNGVKFQLFTLNDITKEMQQIVNVLNIIVIIILLGLFVIIMVGVINLFQMFMMERTKEIGTLRALGMQKRTVRALFLYEAFFISVIGVVIGIIIASGTMVVLKQIYWGVDSPVFMLMKNGHITFKIHWWQVLINFLIVTILIPLAALFPANKAAQLQPVEAFNKIN